MTTITLATLEQATEQEVFDQVSQHLITLDAQSTDDRTCQYHYGALQCAAGCLISDEEYKPEMEGLPWSRLCEKYVVTVAHSILITELQHIHDQRHPDVWDEALNKLAAEYGLEVNFIYPH